MKTIKRISLMCLGAAMTFACQNEGDDLISDFSEESMVAEISADDLPEAAQDFIETDFPGEIVVGAYQITESTGEIYFESFLTNSVSVVFENSGEVVGFGEESGMVSCDGRSRDGFKKKKGRKERRDSTDTETRERPEEITLADLPSAASDYLAENYADTAIHKILKATLPEGDIVYLALIAKVGIVVFDADGAFVEVRTRKTDCATFESVAIEDLPETVTAYIMENYPEGNVLRARTGTIQEVAQIHVLIEEIGVLIFDAEGIFLKLKECKPKA